MSLKHIRNARLASYVEGITYRENGEFAASKCYIRHCVQKISSILFFECSSLLPDESCLVPIHRAGDFMMIGILEKHPDALIGSVLFQRDEKHNPIHYYTKIEIIKGVHYFLLDPSCGTGGSMKAGANELMKLGVPQDYIVAMTIFGARQGLDSFTTTYPDITLIAVDIDNELIDGYIYKDGVQRCGDIGDRLFGTKKVL